MNQHDFCRVLLAEVRKEAKEANVELPVKMVALSSGKDHYFVQGTGEPGAYVSGCCAYSAKAQRISDLIEKKKASG